MPYTGAFCYCVYNKKAQAELVGWWFHEPESVAQLQLRLGQGPEAGICVYPRILLCILKSDEGSQDESGLTLALVKAYTWSSPHKQLCDSPGPCLSRPGPGCVCVCGIIVGGRTCILMEMDSTAINISKYIYNGFGSVQCVVSVRVREGRSAVRAIRGFSKRRPGCNGLIIRWAGALWPLHLQPVSNRSRVEEKWLF